MPVSKRKIVSAIRVGACVCFVLACCLRFSSSSDLARALYTFTVVANTCVWSFVPSAGEESEYRPSVLRGVAVLALFMPFYFLMVRLGWFGTS